MNEPREPLDRELQRMLAVDPSQGIQQRIRARAFAAPIKRRSPFALGFGLAGMAAAVLLLVTYKQPEATRIVPNPQGAAMRAITPAPAVQTEVSPTTNELPRPSRSVRRSNHPVVAVLAQEPPADPRLAPVRMELLPLKGLELTNSVPPIPQPVFSIAILQPFNIEPPALAVQNMGVSE
jgi:hypothetical protein